MEGFGQPNSTAQKTKVNEKVDYLNLPCPLPFEEINREAMMCLKTELFEGFRFDFNKGLNHKFSLCHSVLMGPAELPDQPPGSVIKIPTSNYQFSAYFLDPKWMLFGRMMTDGTLNARVKCDLTDSLAVVGNAQISNQKDRSHGEFTCDYKGSDYRTRLQILSGSIFMANYIQQVTPKLSLGGDILWLGELWKSGVGYAARYETDQMIASGQVASTGVTIMNYVHKVTEKVSLAAEFMYNFMSREVTTSVGYHCNLRQCRLRGKIDSNGVASAYLEEHLVGPGLRFLISAELDHVKKDYKFGFGLSIG